MATRAQMLGKEVIGWALLVLAIVLFPVPVIPSVLFMCGLLALSSRYCWAAKLLAKAREVAPVWIAPILLPVENTAVSELNV
jgi:Putative transmembrane protein (PGPGW)